MYLRVVCWVNVSESRGTGSLYSAGGVGHGARCAVTDCDGYFCL